MTKVIFSVIFSAFITVILLHNGRALKCAVCKPDLDENVEETNNIVKDGGVEPTDDGYMDKSNYEAWPLCTEVNSAESDGTIHQECPDDAEYVCSFSYVEDEQYATRACVKKMDSFLVGRCINKDVVNDQGTIDCSYQLFYCAEDLCNDEVDGEFPVCNASPRMQTTALLVILAAMVAACH